MSYQFLLHSFNHKIIIIIKMGTYHAFLIKSVSCKFQSMIAIFFARSCCRPETSLKSQSTIYPFPAASYLRGVKSRYSSTIFKRTICNLESVGSRGVESYECISIISLSQVVQQALIFCGQRIITILLLRQNFISDTIYHFVMSKNKVGNFHRVIIQTPNLLR